MAYCINCGNRLDPGDAFCAKCGSKIDGVTVTEEPPRTAAYNPAANAGYAPGSQAQTYASDGRTQVFSSNGSAPPPPGTRPAGAQNYWNSGQAVRGQAYQQAGQQAQTSKAPIIIAVVAVVLIAAAAIAFFALRGFSDKMYQVSFETAGGTPVAASQVKASDTVTTPAEPTRQGYKFAGWYEDATYTHPVVFPLSVNENKVLYAKWEPVDDNIAAGTGSTSTTNGGGATSTIAGSQSSSSAAATSTPKSESSASAPATVDSRQSVVTASFTGGDGVTRTEQIRRQGASERVIPDSNVRRITRSEAAQLTDAERCIAWNEIIASSNGYVFKNSGLRNYFNGCNWYMPRSGADAGGNLSKEASDNVELLKSMTSDWWKSLKAA